MTDTQGQAIVAVLARYQPQRNAIAKEMGPSQTKGTTSGVQPDRTILLAKLRVLAQAEQAEIDSVLTPAQIASFQDLVARSHKPRAASATTRE